MPHILFLVATSLGLVFAPSARAQAGRTTVPADSADSAKAVALARQVLAQSPLGGPYPTTVTEFTRFPRGYLILLAPNQADSLVLTADGGMLVCVTTDGRALPVAGARWTLGPPPLQCRQAWPLF
jgi:hypothetical protein